MENNNSAAERIRPILQAMERSIDLIRRRRTQDQPENVQPTPTEQVQRQANESPPQDDTPPTRLKAKPKRLPSPFLSSGDDQTYHSKAG